MSEKVVAQAEKFVREGKLDKAIKEYEKILTQDPREVRTKLKIADLHTRRKEMAKAIKCYREAGDHYLQESFPLKAIAVFKTILKLSPTSVDINEKLGDLFHQVGLDQDAIGQYHIVAGYYDNKGKTKEAMAIRQKIVDLDPSNTTGRIRLAELLQAEGKPEESYEEYDKVAKLLAEKKDREGLAEIYEKMLHFRPNNKEMLKELCQIYFAKREFKKALKKLEAGTSAFKDDLEIGLLWCEALLEDRQLDQARKRFRILYSAALESKKLEMITKIKSRILQEFVDDEDYIKDIHEMTRQANLPAPEAKPKFRQDFEKTEMFDLESSFNPPEKK